MALTLRIVEILFPLFAIIALGAWVGARTQPDLTAVNRLNMDLFVPALVVDALSRTAPKLELLLPLATSAALLLLGSGAVGWILARLLKVPLHVALPPMMFNNCGNLGIPLALLAFGQEGLAAAVVLFLVSNVAHFSFGVWLLDRSTRLSALLRTPVVLASLIGLSLALTGTPLWTPLETTLAMLGEVSIPMMLFALGVRLANSPLSHWRVGLILGIARPLVGIGLAALVLMLWPLLGYKLEPLHQAQIFLFGALPPAVLNYLFAERYGKDPQLLAAAVLMGHLIALIALPSALAWVLQL